MCESRGRMTKSSNTAGICLKKPNEMKIEVSRRKRKLISTPHPARFLDREEPVKQTCQHNWRPWDINDHLSWYVGLSPDSSFLLTHTCEGNSEWLVKLGLYHLLSSSCPNPTHSEQVGMKQLSPALSASQKTRNILNGCSNQKTQERLHIKTIPYYE